MSVKVNEQVVRLFELKEMTVGDALLAANISTRKLYGRPGVALSIHLNNQTIHIPGGHGQAAIVKVNGLEATTKTIIKNLDIIELMEGKDGTPGTATVRDLLDEAIAQSFSFEGETHIVEPRIFINGVPSSADTELKERDKITIETVQTVEQLLHYIGKEMYIHKLKPYTITINEKNHYIPTLTPTLLINGVKGKLESPIKDNDVITISSSEAPTLEILANALDKKIDAQIEITFQNEKVKLYKECSVVKIGEVTIHANDVVRTGSILVWEEINTTPWIFQDVFRFSEWTLPENAGSFQILRNGQPSRFDEEIFGGDHLEILFN